MTLKSISFKLHTHGILAGLLFSGCNKRQRSVSTVMDKVPTTLTAAPTKVQYSWVSSCLAYQAFHWHVGTQREAEVDPKTFP